VWIIAVAGGETADLPSEADPMHLARDYKEGFVEHYEKTSL
jgi:hypothetical protein